MGLSIEQLGSLKEEIAGFVGKPVLTASWGIREALHIRLGIVKRPGLICNPERKPDSEYPRLHISTSSYAELNNPDTEPIKPHARLPRLVRGRVGLKDYWFEAPEENNIVQIPASSRTCYLAHSHDSPFTRLLAFGETEVLKWFLTQARFGNIQQPKPGIPDLPPLKPFYESFKDPWLLVDLRNIHQLIGGGFDLPEEVFSVTGSLKRTAIGELQALINDIPEENIRTSLRPRISGYLEQIKVLKLNLEDPKFTDIIKLRDTEVPCHIWIEMLLGSLNLSIPKDPVIGHPEQPDTGPILSRRMPRLQGQIKRIL